MDLTRRRCLQTSTVSLAAGLAATQGALAADKTRVAAARGEFELYETTNRFDGTAQNPKWLGLS